ncbi:unnamed protein product [Ranitomeya imitator]|uniref:GST C-terminal domain-containing protein n=1 Tax=Ranitomeya imitator TaxID=111125 RepID=A0ABN9KUH5_9NEOB|nr:unnamed protein product [Ranitomeya imitator]
MMNSVLSMFSFRKRAEKKAEIADRQCAILGMTPYVLGHEAAPENVNPALSELNGTLTAIETKFLQDKPFFAGDEISIADLVAIVEIMQAIAFGVDVFEDKPKLSAWKQRVEEAIGADLFKETHESIIMCMKEYQSLPPELKEGYKTRLDWHIRGLPAPVQQV